MYQQGQHAKPATVEDLVESSRRLVEEGKPVEALGIIQQLHGGAPENAEVLRLLGGIFFRLDKWDRALAHYDSVISLQPDCAVCYFERGTVSLLSGNRQSAMDDFSSCLALDPEYAPALASRAVLLLQASHYEEALRDITAAAFIRPNNDGDIHNRAVVLTHMGRFKEAIEEYERALTLNPHSGGTHNNLAWLLATSRDPSMRDGKRAVEHALRAVELGKNSAWTDTLAAAYAESGDFAAAVRTEEEAYQLSGECSVAYLKRLELYRCGVSYAAWRDARRRDEDL
jgi:tetratricopeptide (TPR) repeat protein